LPDLQQIVARDRNLDLAATSLTARRSGSSGTICQPSFPTPGGGAAKRVAADRCRLTALEDRPSRWLGADRPGQPVHCYRAKARVLDDPGRVPAEDAAGDPGARACDRTVTETKSAGQQGSCLIGKGAPGRIRTCAHGSGGRPCEVASVPLTCLARLFDRLATRRVPRMFRILVARRSTGRDRALARTLNVNQFGLPANRPLACHTGPTRPGRGWPRQASWLRPRGVSAAEPSFRLMGRLAGSSTIGQGTSLLACGRFATTSRTTAL
jgi:hypothetical protein